MGASSLTLAEQLLLVAFDPARRRVTGGPHVYLGAAGALVLDLLETGVASLREGQLTVANPPAGDTAGALAAQAVARDSRGRDLGHWVRHFGAPRFRLGQRLLAALVARGILEESVVRRFGLFRVRRYALRTPAVRDHLLESARAALLSAAAAGPPATPLPALLGACGLADRVVAPDERPVARRRAAELVRGDPGATAVSGVVREVQSEVVASVSAAVVAATSTADGGAGHGGHGH